MELQRISTWHPGFVSILLACVIGGLVGGAAVHMMHPLFPYRDLPPIDLNASAELVQQHKDAAFEFRSWNYAADLGIMGLVLGLSFGALAGGRIVTALTGGIAGGLLGAGLGFAGGRFAANAVWLNAEQTLHESLGLQALVWGLIWTGIVLSVAVFKVSASSAVKYAAVGLVTGICIAMTNFILSSFMFPTSNPLFLVPDSPSERIYWLVVVAIISGVVLALGFRQSGSDKPTDKSSAPVT